MTERYRKIECVFDPYPKMTIILQYDSEDRRGSTDVATRYFVLFSVFSPVEFNFHTVVPTCE